MTEEEAARQAMQYLVGEATLAFEEYDEIPECIKCRHIRASVFRKPCSACIGIGEGSENNFEPAGD